MKILITGGAGFIASHLVDAYIAAGHQVVIIDNLSTGSVDNINPQAEFVETDINTHLIRSVIKKFKPDIINHHAAQINVRFSVDNPITDAQTNILGFINLLESARSVKSVKKIIFASTGGAIYGETQTIPTPESIPAQPMSPYGISKRSGELYLHYYHKVHSLPYTILRYSNVYGPRQNAHGEAGVIAIFYQKLQNHQPFTINGNGEQTRDFIFVKDVVRANLLASESNHVGIYNIGTGVETSINQLVKKLTRAVKYDQNIPHGPAISGEVDRSCLNIEKAGTDLHWQPETGIDQGILQTASAFVSSS